MRSSVFVLVFVLLSLLIATPGHATPLAVSTIYIEPTGYEDTSTHEWKGSFWVITATTDTKESFVFYQFNETEASSFGQNKIDNKAIVPIATIKITITPRQPYWERPLRAEDPWMVYPKTYGTYRNYITKLPSKIEETYVEALYAEVLSCGVDDLWTRHTPFDVTVEKIGTNPFTQTERVDTIGGTEILVLTNPADSSEKLMISNLGQLGTGYGQPSIDEIIIFEKGTESIAFDRTKVENAIKYGRNLDTGGVLSDESYAFYWFGGGSTYLAPSSHEEVRWYFDDKSPAHAVYIGALEYRKLVEDSDFPGSYRDDGPNFWDERALPIAADIWDDNVATNPIGLSLINYLKQKIKGEVDLNKSWGQGWTITEGNKLRIYMPSGAASSLITIKISTELADSVVYQPIVGNGKIEQAFWDSTKTTKSLIKDNETAVLKVKQYASKTSKLTVTPSIPANVPVSVSPLMDSAIVDPNAVHTFQFEIRNLGTQVNQSSTVTFTITNDLGTVTDTATLDFDLIVIENPQPNPQPKDTGLEGDPLWIWLVAVVSITVATASVYGVYTYRSSRKRTLGKKEQNQ